MRSLALFVGLGALLFAVDRTLDAVAFDASAARAAASYRPSPVAPTPEDDIRLLAAAAREAGIDRADPVVRARLVRNLRFLGHEGSDATLVRDALALGMDRSDVVIERRLADRMAARLRAVAFREPPSDATLRSWYERNGDRWRQPPAVSFTHVFVSREHHGAGAEARARDLLEGLRTDRIDPADAPGRGDPFLLGARVPLRSAPDLAHQLGRAFADAVTALEPGGWSGPIGSSYGLHLVWVHEQRAAAQLPFEQVRAQVADAWFELHGDERLRDAIVSLRFDRDERGE
jgi:hypothetical protein